VAGLGSFGTGDIIKINSFEFEIFKHYRTFLVLGIE
jgi:hypothetical protein